MLRENNYKYLRNTKMNSHLKIFVFLIILAQVTLCSAARARCPSSCRCPLEAPVCARGVRLVQDECECCTVCARQVGEPCSEMQPCDTGKGLRCDYGANPRRRPGVCVAQEGNSCVLDGSVYQNGETFYPSCSHQCVCRDGQIGCVPRCNLDVMLPGPECPFPRKVQLPGECCEKWVCEPQAEFTALGGLALAAYRQEETLGFDQWDPSLNCIEQTTEWGACSKTCGMGISTRVTNKNPRCEMLKQIRLCMVRPCENLKQQSVKKPLSAPSATQGSKCLKTKKSTEAIHFTFRNCTSIQAFRPRFCGQCDDGRCCTPHGTKTAQVEFKCLDGKAIKRPVMFINSCVCHHHCPRDNAAHRASDANGGTFRL